MGEKTDQEYSVISTSDYPEKFFDKAVRGVIEKDINFTENDLKHNEIINTLDNFKIDVRDDETKLNTLKNKTSHFLDGQTILAVEKKQNVYRGTHYVAITLNILSYLTVLIINITYNIGQDLSTNIVFLFIITNLANLASKVSINKIYNERDKTTNTENALNGTVNITSFIGIISNISLNNAIVSDRKIAVIILLVISLFLSLVDTLLIKRYEDIELSIETVIKTENDQRLASHLSGTKEHLQTANTKFKKLSDDFMKAQDVLKEVVVRPKD